MLQQRYGLSRYANGARRFRDPRNADHDMAQQKSFFRIIPNDAQCVAVHLLGFTQVVHHHARQHQVGIQLGVHR